MGNLFSKNFDNVLDSSIIHSFFSIKNSFGSDKVFERFISQKEKSGYPVKDIWTYEFQVYNHKPVTPDTNNGGYESTISAPADDLTF